MRRCTAIAALALVATLIAITSPAGAALRACGNVGGANEAPRAVRAEAISCRGAKDLAVAHWLVSGRFDKCALRKRRCTVRGFECRRTTSDDETRIACTRRAVRVHFAYAP